MEYFFIIMQYIFFFAFILAVVKLFQLFGRVKELERRIKNVEGKEQ